MEMEQCLNKTGLVVSNQQISLPSTSSHGAKSFNDSTFITPDANEMETEQCLKYETGLIVSNQEISSTSSSSCEANRLNNFTRIKPDPDDTEYNVNKTTGGPGVSNQELPLKCEVKEEIMYCKFCSYCDIDCDRLKFHTFTKHPTEAAVVNFGESNHDIKFFCVKETCNFSTTICTVYEEHLMNCCLVRQTLSGKVKERLKSTLNFVFDFHTKHCLSDVTGLLEYFTNFNKAYRSEDSHVQLRKHVEHDDLFSVLPSSSSSSDFQSSTICEDVGERKLVEYPFSLVQNPVPVFIVQNQNTNLIESQTVISDISISVKKQKKNNDYLVKTGPSDMKISKSKVHPHMETHAGKKSFLCVECKKCFQYHSDLLKHTRMHTGEKLFKCDVCDKAFSRSYHLIAHKITHTGEKPFKCDVCDRAFNRSHHLKTHKRTHTGEKPFTCPECEKSFSIHSNFRRHLKTHPSE